MRFFSRLVATCACLLSLSQLGQCSSQARDALNYLALIENPRIHTYNQKVHSHSHFDLTFDLHKDTQHIRLSLEPNNDILGDDVEIQFIDKDGNIRAWEKIVREDHKVFQGQAYTINEDGTSDHVGWSRIMIRRDGDSPLFEGAFSVMGDDHHIQLKDNYISTKHPKDPSLPESDQEFMICYRDSDVGRLSHTELSRRSAAKRGCAADQLDFNTDPQHPVHAEIQARSISTGAMSPYEIFGLTKRQSSIDGGTPGNGNSAGVNLRNTIGDTSGCPSSRKVALMGIATDCTYTASFNSTESLRNSVINTVNTASNLYQQSFNITLGLRNLTISDAECPGTPSTATPWNVQCSDSTTITNRLNTFSSWRSSQVGDTNAYWSLFTTCNTGAEVGLAWLGQLCNHAGTQQQSSDTSGNTQTVAGANVIVKTSNEWQVFAHETGHTFGAVHDCDASVCADANAVSSSQCCPLSATACDAQAQYMMNPYSSSTISRFSPCSLGNICSALGRNSVSSQCLSDNRNVVTITGNQCGNGIVEDGEDCDCGGTAGCGDNPCCNPSTCKFTAGSQCDPSNEGCCTSQCKFAPAGQVCRASSGICDPAETCSGANATCPTDTFTPDKESCGSGLQCASGQCTSRDQQCKTAMGSYTQGNDTYSCNSQTCTISCGSPDFGPNVCYSLQQNFLDGTICGGGGICSNGVCKGSTAGGEIKSWIDDNKTIVIAVASVLGGFLVLALLGCCFRACRRAKQPRRVAPSRGRTGKPSGWQGPPIPPAMQQRGYGPPAPEYDRSWPPPQSVYPQQPPPSYGAQPWTQGPGLSVRYA